MWVIAAVAAVVAGFWLARELHRPAPSLASGTWLPQPWPVGDFALVDDAGRPFTRRELVGHPALVFFGFTHCPDVCPTTLAMLAQVKKAAAIGGLQVWLVSVDPQRDTPQVLHRYVQAFDTQFGGVTGNQTEVARLAKDFAVAVNRVELPGGDYTMDHSAAVFLLNDHAQRVAVFTPPFDATKIAADLRSVASRLKS